MPPPLSTLLRRFKRGQSLGKIEVFCCDPASKRMIPYWSLWRNSPFCCLLKDGGQRSGLATGQHSGVACCIRFMLKDTFARRFLLNFVLASEVNYLLALNSLKGGHETSASPFKLAVVSMCSCLLGLFRTTFQNGILKHPLNHSLSTLVSFYLHILVDHLF